MSSTSFHPAELGDVAREEALRRAIERYIFQPLPGAERTVEYNRSRVEARIREEDDPANARIVERVLQVVEPAGRILEVGSGSGGLSAALAARGYEVDGVEPNADGVEASRLRALRYPDRKLRACEGVVEKLPFAADSFDGVVSTQVLEHVPNLEQAIRECLRVLKPGGASLHLMPNYAFPFEPHYRVVYPPRASKGIGRWYLRLRGRDTGMLDDSIFPTIPRRVVETFRRAGYVHVENRYAREVEEKLSGSAVRTPVVRRALAFARTIRLLPLVRFAVVGLELYPSIVIMAWKPRASSPF
jgi:SAM-dependent methyltransferase